MPTPKITGTMIPRIWSTRVLSPHPFNPHILLRLTMAKGTTTRPTQANEVAQSTSGR